MRVLLFCSANMDQATGSGIRGRLLAEGLRRNGASVCTVTGGIPDGFHELGIESVLLAGTEPLRVTLQRVLDAFRPDVLLGVTEAWADVVVKVARTYQCFVVFDVHGIGVVEILELGRGYGARLPRLRNSIRWLRSMRDAQFVTVLSPTMLRPAHLFSRDVRALYSMTDVSLFSPDGPSAALGHDTARIQVLYAGNFYRYQGMELLLRAIRRVLSESSEFEFTLLGSVGKERDRALVDGYRLPEDRVHFLDAVPYSSVPNYYRAADVLVLPRPLMLSTYLAVPQKLGDYMAAGRAIVATDLAPHRWALGHPEAGILCPPTPRGLAAGILRSRDRSLRDECGRLARARAVEMFDHVRQTQSILEEFEKLLQTGKEADR